MSKQIEKLLGISLFTWEYWDDMGEGDYHFYRVEWLFPSMEQFNGGGVTMRRDGTFMLHDSDGVPIDTAGADYRNPLKIKEFKEALLNQIQQLYTQ